MTSEPKQGSNPDESHSPQPHTRELDLFGFIAIMLRHLPFILGCGLLFFLVMVVNMLRTKPLFESTAVMIIPQGNITSRSLEDEISRNTIDLLGGGYELYADILTSRTIADRIIKDYDLKKVYGTSVDESAEAILSSRTRLLTQREGLIRVTVSDTDKQRAADLANDYLHQLDALNYQLVLSSISAERAYLERELVKEKDALADAEVALKQVQETSSGVAPEAEANAGFSAVEQTRAMLRADEVQLAALLVGETEANPEVARLRGQIASLKSQLGSLQNGGDPALSGDPTVKVPEKVLVYTRLLRDVKFHEELFGLLEKDFEAAKQEEAKTPSIVQVLDPAVPSFHKAWPPRTYYCLLAGFAGLVVGVVLVALWVFLRAYFRNPRNAVKLQQLKSVYKKQPDYRI
jgi:uncharacterized protein involved in exopolysaccharide biosynthesis